MKDVPATTANLMTKIIPLKHDLEEVDLEADVDTELTEQTTASIKSASTPAKNQFEMDATEKEIDATKESEGRVKRFFNEIKNNCKTADTVVESEVFCKNKTSKNHFISYFIPFLYFFFIFLQWKRPQCSKHSKWKTIH